VTMHAILACPYCTGECRDYKTTYSTASAWWLLDEWLASSLKKGSQQSANNNQRTLTYLFIATSLRSYTHGRKPDVKGNMQTCTCVCNGKAALIREGWGPLPFSMK